MLKLICLNAYSLRDRAFSIVFKSYHLTLKVNIEGNGGEGGAVIHLAFLHLSLKSISLKVSISNSFYISMPDR